LREDEGGEAPQEKYVEGEFIGSLALLSDMRRLFSLKALTDMTCLILTRDKFAKVMEQFPELMPKILKSVVDGVRAWEERLLIDQDGLCEACRQKAGVSLI
jgi:CRP-like cAMP-binding protein